MPPSAAHRSLFDRVCRNPETGEVAIAQAPNAPLIVFLAASSVRVLFHPHGDVAAAVSIAASVSLAVWAGLEVARGDSLLRRVVGAVVLGGIVVGLALR